MILVQLKFIWGGVYGTQRVKTGCKLEYEMHYSIFFTGNNSIPRHCIKVSGCMLVDSGVPVWCLFPPDRATTCCGIFPRGLVFNYDFFIKTSALESAIHAQAQWTPV